MEHMLRCLRRNTKDRGALAVEYGLMAIVASLVVAVIVLLGQLPADGLSEKCESITTAAVEGETLCSSGTEGGDHALPPTAP
jgi:Flp pilus assembly pilin Flp